MRWSKFSRLRISRLHVWKTQLGPHQGAEVSVGGAVGRVMTGSANRWRSSHPSPERCTCQGRRGPASARAASGAASSRSATAYPINSGSESRNPPWLAIVGDATPTADQGSGVPHPGHQHIGIARPIAAQRLPTGVERQPARRRDTGSDPRSTAPPQHEGCGYQAHHVCSDQPSVTPGHQRVSQGQMRDQHGQGKILPREFLPG